MRSVPSGPRRALQVGTSRLGWSLSDARQEIETQPLGIARRTRCSGAEPRWGKPAGWQAVPGGAAADAAADTEGMTGIEPAWPVWKTG